MFICSSFVTCTQSICHVQFTVYKSSKNFLCLCFQISKNLEAAAQLNWTSGNSNTSFQVGCKYDLDKDTTIRVRHVL